MPLYTNQLMNALPQAPAMGLGQSAPMPNALMAGAPRVPVQQQVSPQAVQELHQHLSDTQDAFKKLIKLPDDELNLSKLYGAASDLVTLNRISGKKRGIDAMTIAGELSSKDFPREKPNGEKPSPQEIRAYLMRHFNNHVNAQARLTSMFGPPAPKPQIPVQSQGGEPPPEMIPGAQEGMPQNV